MLNLRKYFPVNGPAEIQGPVLTSHTPDIWKLEQFETQFIFVADDTLNGLLQEAALVPEPTFGSCYTFMPYTLWRKDLGKASYAVILPGTYRPSGFVRWPVESFPIRGKVWNIRPSQFILLDKAKQNGVQFERKRIDISYPYCDIRYSRKRPLPQINDNHVVFSAWAYLGIPDYWDSQIGGVFASSQLEVMDAPARLHKRFYQFE